MEGIIDAVLTLLDLDFTCTADLDDRDAAGELGKTLLEPLLVIVAGRVLDLRPDRVDPALTAIRGASAIDEGRSVLVDRDALGGTQHLQRDVLQLHAPSLGDHFALRQDCAVFDHRLAFVSTE